MRFEFTKPHGGILPNFTAAEAWGSPHGLRPPAREAHEAEERVVPWRTKTQNLTILTLPNITAVPGRREDLVAILTNSNALDGPKLTNYRHRLL